MARPFSKIRFHHYVLTAIWPTLAYAFVGQPMRALLLSVPLVMLGAFVAGIGHAQGGLVGAVAAYFVVISLPMMFWLNQFEGHETKSGLGLSGVLFWLVVLIALALGGYSLVSKSDWSPRSAMSTESVAPV